MEYENVKKMVERVGVSKEHRMTLITTLEATRKLIEDPKHWVQEASAKTTDGLITSPTDSKAVCWCLSGALYKVTDRKITIESPLERNWVLDLVNHDLRVILTGNDRMGSIAEFNDSVEHRDVIEFLDQVIRAAREIDAEIAMESRVS